MQVILEGLRQFWVSLQNGQLPQLGFWTYFLLASLVAIEGPASTLLGAAAASAGLMQPGWVFIAAAMGNMAADSLWYLLGYFGKLDKITRFGEKLGFGPGRMQVMERGIKEHATRIIFLAKLTMGFIIPSLVAAGLLRISWRKWFPAIFTGEMIWTGTLVVIGFFASELIKRVEKGVEYLAVGSIIAFTLFLLFMGRNLLRKHVNQRGWVKSDEKE